MLRGENNVAKSFGNADLPQPRMGDRTAHERHIARAGEAVIADILPASAEEPLILLAKYRGSDSELGHPLRSSLFLSLAPAIQLPLPISWATWNLAPQHLSETRS